MTAPLQPAEPKPWDQYPGETEAQYLQFRYYLDMGPKRSLNEAYRLYAEDAFPEDKAPKGPSGHFKKLSRQFEWDRRAVIYDLDQMGTYGLEIARDYFTALKHVAAKVVDAAENEMIDSIQWDRILESLEFLGKHLEPAIQAGKFEALKPAVAHAAGPVQAAIESAVSDRDAVR